VNPPDELLAPFAAVFAAIRADGERDLTAIDDYADGCVVAVQWHEWAKRRIYHAEKHEELLRRHGDTLTEEERRRNLPLEAAALRHAAGLGCEIAEEALVRAGPSPSAEVEAEAEKAVERARRLQIAEMDEAELRSQRERFEQDPEERRRVAAQLRWREQTLVKRVRGLHRSAEDRVRLQAVPSLADDLRKTVRRDGPRRSNGRSPRRSVQRAATSSRDGPASSEPSPKPDLGLQPIGELLAVELVELARRIAKGR
jgi:hypothetical protein